jgi:hypothetical protein
MLFIKLFICVLAGLAGHQTWNFTRMFGEKWGTLVRYAIGLLIFIPAQILVKASLPKPTNYYEELERDGVSGLLSAGGVGTGVLIGYILGDKE